MFALLIILLFGLLGSKALFHPGFFTSHDGWHQVNRLYHFHVALTDGQFPPRWAGEVLHGYGYPLFYFTYQLPFYIGEFFHQLGFSLWDAVKIVFVLSYFISGLTMYGFAKSLWGARPGLLCAILYLWAPYRFSTMFVRGSLGEHVTFLFLPIVFWGILKIARERYRTGMLLLALGTAGMILSHALTTQFMLPALLVFAAVFWIHAPKKRAFLAAIAGGGMLGVGLSSYYLIPAITARTWIVGFNPLHFADHFPTLNQLLYSPWGYGFSFGGGDDDGMSFQIGIAQWITLALAAFIIIFLRKRFDWIALTLFLIAIASIFFMLAPSTPVWAAIRHTMTIDFPWRLLGMTTFVVSLLAGYVMKSITSRIFSFPLFLLLIALALYTNRNHTRVNLYEENPQQYINPAGTTSSYEEYAPIWATVPLAREAPENRIEIIEGSGETELLQKTSRVLSARVNATTPVWIHINQFYFPPWEVSIDGQWVDDDYTFDGIWKVYVPAGIHNVTLELQETPTNIAANLTTLLSGGIVFPLWRVRGKRQKS